MNTDTSDPTETPAQQIEHLRETCARRGFTTEQTREEIRSFSVANGLTFGELGAIILAPGPKAGA